MDIKTFITGPIETNTYLIYRDKKAFIIDPSKDCGAIINYINDNGLLLESILLTHGHFDHFLGLEEMVSAFPDVNIYAHPKTQELLLNPEMNGSYMLGIKLVFDGVVHNLHETTMTIGSFTMDILHIPGHSPGGLAFVLDKHCFSGDSLFSMSVGRTDFPGCNGPELFKNIKEKLLVLDVATIVYPGHGQATTIGRERAGNPFLR